MNTFVRCNISQTCGQLLLRRFRHNPSAQVVQTLPSAPFSRREKRKEVVVNTKYDKCSEPMYRHLLYSTELDVFLTVKRGKVWLEKMHARDMAAKRELREREVAAMNPCVPVALQYLYGGANIVQGEDTASTQETFEAETIPELDVKLAPEVDAWDGPANEVEMYPYQVYSSIHQTQTTLDTESGDVVRGRGRRRVSRRYRPDEDLVKDEFSSADYDVIRNDLLNPEIRDQFSEDHLFKHGTPNPAVPTSSVGCGGCGAALHCREEKIPGYIPSELLDNRSREELHRTLCQRCYFIKEYNIALKVSVSPEDYPATISHLKDKDALVLLVVDLLDFPGSVWPNILDILGTNKKIILIGNKVDLLLPDQSGYIKNITEIMRTEFLKKCFHNSQGNIFPKLISALCVSAKTGFNLETLVDKIFRYWRWNNNSLPGDIYILGCTNVGKSSIFNALLDSDLCKVRALDLVSKAITSPVPGTTLNLLKFPVTRPEPHFINDRTVRIREAMMAFTKIEKERLENLRRYKTIEYATPSTYLLTHTLKNSLKERQPLSGYLTETDVRKTSDLPEALDPSSSQFSYGKWCFDSPGTVSQDQIINLLTAEEISATLPVSPLVPRSLLMRVGHSLLLGGLGRLDYVEGVDLPPVTVTVFASEKLPLNMIETEGVEEFLVNAAGSNLTAVPQGGANRLRDFPQLLGQQVELTGVSLKVGSKDIVLSSSGWVMVTAGWERNCVFIAYTPGGKGITVRDPFLPFAVNQKGRRIMGSPAYRSDRLYLDKLD